MAEALLDDLHVLDVRTWQWLRLNAGGAHHPAARCSHVAAVVDGLMYILGGEGVIPADPPPRNGPRSAEEDSTDDDGPPRGEAKERAARYVMLGDMHALDLTTQAEWRRIEPAGGAAPCARSGAAAASLGRRVFVFGGWDRRRRELNDLWEFHVGTCLWSELAVRDGIVPTPRTSASLVAHPDRLLLFGGCDARGPCAEIHAEMPGRRDICPESQPRLSEPRRAGSASSSSTASALPVPPAMARPAGACSR